MGSPPRPSFAARKRGRRTLYHAFRAVVMAQISLLPTRLRSTHARSHTNADGGGKSTKNHTHKAQTPKLAVRKQAHTTSRARVQEQHARGGEGASGSAGPTQYAYRAMGYNRKAARPCPPTVKDLPLSTRPTHEIMHRLIATSQGCVFHRAETVAQHLSGWDEQGACRDRLPLSDNGSRKSSSHGHCRRGHHGKKVAKGEGEQKSAGFRKREFADRCLGVPTNKN
jgi:hypothetical protein